MAKLKWEIRRAKVKEEVKGLQAFSFCVATVNYEHTKPRFKRKIKVKFKDSICLELCLKLCFERDWLLCNITELGWFWKRLSRHKVLNNHFRKSVEKVTIQRCIADLLTVIFNQWLSISFLICNSIKLVIINNDIYLHKKLSTKLLVQVANEDTKSMFLIISS